ncbi:PREDICTED: RNA-directed DNA polymerase homolog [Rhagoletis zephyria]|uniref:RNA-directed DNA polymerase homolog n=1 Tax=Rhagoletis zephyria TaxID=28612 RepID=UPI00081124F1|nr:PREDICTED: RNA-directed DNA polymerase homolog [Rhagoletis zephyria]XP_017471986.1 PREDICTED: RNA-directed DNA polymerase homolog [Rhagoletis zephyria]
MKDTYPLPIIDGILSRLPKAEFITSLDPKDAFWQIPLELSSRDKTDFTVPGKPLYQFKVMPFGLCNAPQTLSRLMDRVIPAHLKTQVFVYLDDLLVISESFEKHIVVLREVAKCIRSSGLTMKKSPR